MTFLNQSSSLDEVSSSLNRLDRHPIDIAPWAPFPYKPKSDFAIAHNNDCIFLKYFVQEQVIKAAYYQPDDPVYKDSCVEFFIAYDDEEPYYNLEFNAIGTCKLNFGKNRHNRQVIGESLVRTIRFLTTIENAENEIQWSITLLLPVSIFSQHTFTQLSGKVCAANFYKCGDDLPKPHFLCWNNIDTPEPDFHVRRCFGKVYFL